jgi:hypothetical protein
MIAGYVEASINVYYRLNSIALGDPTLYHFPIVNSSTRRVSGGIRNVQFALRANNFASVSYLPTHFTVEGCFLKDNSNSLPLLGRFY